MEKIYLIGRDSDCDICINDESNLVSRHHAELIIHNGRYHLIDHSSNGTFINGIRVKSDCEIPVSRKDSIDFAHVWQLNWEMIEDPLKKRRIIVAACLGALLLSLIIMAICLLNCKSNSKSTSTAPADVIQTEKTVTTEAPAPSEEAVEAVAPKQTESASSKKKEKSDTHEFIRYMNGTDKPDVVQKEPKSKAKAKSKAKNKSVKTDSETENTEENNTTDPII